jgi:DNA-directed RNA polymerase subunit beta'
MWLNHYMTVFLGRVSLHDIYHPQTGELIIASGSEINEDDWHIIENSPIEMVEIVLYLLVNRRPVYAVNVTDVTLLPENGCRREKLLVLLQRSPSVSLVHSLLSVRSTSVVQPSKAATETSIVAKFNGKVEFEEEIYHQVVKRAKQMLLSDVPEKFGLLIRKHVLCFTNGIVPYGAHIFVKEGPL